MGLRVELSYGTGGWEQDGAFGSIDPPEWEPVDSVEDAIEVVKADLSYRLDPSENHHQEFLGGQVKDGDTLVATIEVTKVNNEFVVQATPTTPTPSTPTSPKL